MRRALLNWRDRECFVFVSTVTFRERVFIEPDIEAIRAPPHLVHRWLGDVKLQTFLVTHLLAIDASLIRIKSINVK